MTIAQTHYLDLAETDHPTRRADILTAMADAEELSGHPNSARLLRLIAGTEAILANPLAEPDDDPAWDMDAWWQLAGTTNRSHRADILESLYRDWAKFEFGDESRILLEVAATERVVAGEPVLPPMKGRYRLSIHDQDRHNDTPPANEITPDNPSTTLRDVIAGLAFWPIFISAFVALAAVVIAVPNLTVKMLAGAVLPLMVIGWVAISVLKGGRS